MSISTVTYEFEITT